MNRIVGATFPGLAESHSTEGASAALLARAFAATSRVSLITDAQQNILHASAAFTAITGYSEAEVLGTNCRLLQGPGSGPEDKDAIRRAIAAGDAFDGDILNYRKDGSPFWNRLTIVPLRAPTRGSRTSLACSRTRARGLASRYSSDTSPPTMP